MAYLLRVELPDLPGTLGAVATAFGQVGGDILAMDVVERSRGRAVDDIVVDLPPGRAPDALITAGESVPGVRVESVLPDPGVANALREWELVEAMTAAPHRARQALAAMVPEVLRLGWAAVISLPAGAPVEVLAAGGGVPDLSAVALPRARMHRAGVLPTEADWVPESWQATDTRLAVAPLGTDECVLVGRPGGPAMRAVEVARLAHLASLASVIAGQPAHT
jgi:hypothetical protein